MVGFLDFIEQKVSGYRSLGQQDYWAYLDRVSRQREEAASSSSAVPATSVPSSSSSSPPSQVGPVGTVESINSGVARWSPYVLEASERFGVPPEVLFAIMDIESDGRPEVVSPAGAVGLMQVMPQYHAHRAQKYGGDLRDPKTNIFVGAEILRENFDRIKAKNPNLPDDEAWALAASAYFGAFDWSKLEVTGAKDALGTTGHGYYTLFKDLRAQYRGALYSQPSSLSEGPYPVSVWTGGKEFPLTQGYGKTEFAKTSGFYPNQFHPGIDIGAPAGTPILAPFRAKVVQSGWNGGYGYSVTLEVQQNGKTYHVLVGHLVSDPGLAVGTVVDPGRVLGYVGSTGASTGPHIHLEVRENGSPVDPKVLFVY